MPIERYRKLLSARKKLCVDVEVLGGATELRGVA